MDVWEKIRDSRRCREVYRFTSAALRQASVEACSRRSGACDDSHSPREASVDRDRPHGHAGPRHERLGSAGSGIAGRDPNAAIFLVCGGERQLIKIIWHDGLGMSLYCQAVGEGTVPSGPLSRMARWEFDLAARYMLDGIDLRNTVHSFRPERGIV